MCPEGAVMKKKSKAPLLLLIPVIAAAGLVSYGSIKGFDNIGLTTQKNDPGTSSGSEDVEDISSSDMIFISDDSESDEPAEDIVKAPEVTYDEEDHVVVSYNGEWERILVNRWNTIPDEYEIETVTLDNGRKVDSRIYVSLRAMLEGARQHEVYLYVSEAYRSDEEQREMMKSYTESYIKDGYDEETAKEMAESYVALPGTSEHQLGLALDINADTNISGDNQKVYDWLAENAYRYGFILRYPEGKENITGISFEPWHYRFVGEECADLIHRDGFCLEEYLEREFDPDHWKASHEASKPSESENTANES